MQTSPNRVTKYIPYEAELDMKGIEYPVAARHYGKFENQNNNISINVFGYEDKKIFPLYITKQTEKQHHVNLLLYQEEGKSHYVLIKDLSRLVRSQYSKCHGQHFFCPYCLHGCTSQKILDKHMERCKLHGAQRVHLPEKNDSKGHDKVKITLSNKRLFFYFF